MISDAPSPMVFVVDDDRGLLRLVEKALKREGFSSAVAASGQDAIAWLAEHRADLMLLDLKLQDIEGKELIAHLAEMKRSVPFVIITGQGDERVAVEMMKRGALDYLVKDVNFIEFVPTVVRRSLAQIEKDKRLAFVEKEVLAISEREQRRIGQDLHDGLGQQLTAIELMCASLKDDVVQPSLKKQLAAICQHLRNAVAETRSLAQGLAAFKVEVDGLQAALRALARDTSSLTGVTIRFECESPIFFKGSETATHLFRIAQEAVNNAIKHGQPSEVHIRLLEQPGVVCLEVSDNGRGFSNAKPSSEGMGLNVMRHRADIIGADLDIQSKPGKGVSVICTMRSN